MYSICVWPAERANECAKSSYSASVCKNQGGGREMTWGAIVYIVYIVCSFLTSTDKLLESPLKVSSSWYSTWKIKLNDKPQ